MQKNIPYNLKFYAVFAGYIAIIFFGNWHHANQQGIFYGEYLPIAKHLLNRDGYLIYFGVPTLYPIWGYSFLTMIGELIGSSILFLAYLQAIFCIIGISFFYKLFNLDKKYWHILLFTPFIVLASVRWPDAIVGVLLILTIYYFKQCIENHSKKYAILSGVLFGILLNYRSEYLGLLLILAIICVVSIFLKKKNFFSLSSLTILSTLLILLPWAYYSYTIDKHIRLTATNSGGVLYISLGQLPNNPWGIVHSDSVAYAVAKQNGIDDPYSTKGDSLLTSKFIGDIENNPVAYTEKVGYNIYSSLIRGVYTGEFGGIIEKIIKIIFILVFDFLLLLTSLYFIKNRRSLLVVLAFILIIYKFTLVSLIQYEPRHMNAIYLFLLGPSLLFLKEKMNKNS